VSPAATPERLRLAGRAARVIKEHGAVRDADLLVLLACQPDELRAAIGIVLHWRKADRCGDYLVPVARQGEGRRSA
jgi:hypothetical protein